MDIPTGIGDSGESDNGGDGDSGLGPIGKVGSGGDNGSAGNEDSSIGNVIIAGGGNSSPPQSICIIRAAESFPKPPLEKEDDRLTIPFQELAGESVKYLGRTDDGVLALSNYRIFLHKHSVSSETSVPLGLIETIQVRDLFHLVIMCKDASTVNCSFKTAEQCTEWQRRIQSSISVPEAIESLFAFPFYAWTNDTYPNNYIGNGIGTTGDNNNRQSLPLQAQSQALLQSQSLQLQPATNLTTTNGYFTERLQRTSRLDDDFRNEIDRLGFDLNGSWRISKINAEFRLCSSYPESILVPCCVTDENLQCIANFRSSRRLPAVVWRHQKSGAVLARCSQPEVGWLGWRNYKDEQLLKAIADACAFDRGEQIRLNVATRRPRTISDVSIVDATHEEIALDEVKKMLIVDARSYTSAVTNRARGGGCESIDYYTCADIEFMNLGNIHTIRKSFHALRQLCASNPEDPGWLGQLEKTLWMQHLSGLLSSAMRVCHAIEKKGRPVLVHCSDGWDRTPQIVATAQLCLDPYYRTVEGFRILVEREWLSFGHKFADRCGNGPNADDLNERCPVFLQWLDMVHQIHKQFPCSFEFSLSYLIKLAQHSLSSLFGTFLCNTLKDRIANTVHERTFSVWPFLSGPLYRNPLYMPYKEKVLWPAHNVRFLCVWSEVYLGSLGNKNSLDGPILNTTDSIIETVDSAVSVGSMNKTRSYNDLSTASNGAGVGACSGVCQNDISRRSSDPNMSAEAKLNIHQDNATTTTTTATTSHHKLTSKIVNDTTKKLEQLTLDINNQDEFNLILLQNNATTASVNNQNDEVAAPTQTTSHSGNREDSAAGTSAGKETDDKHLVFVDYKLSRNNNGNIDESLIQQQQQNTSEDNYKENKSSNTVNDIDDEDDDDRKKLAKNINKILGTEESQRIADENEIRASKLSQSMAKIFGSSSSSNIERKSGTTEVSALMFAENPNWPAAADSYYTKLKAMKRKLEDDDDEDDEGEDEYEDDENEQKQSSINLNNGKAHYKHLPEVPDEAEKTAIAVASAFASASVCALASISPGSSPSATSFELQYQQQQQQQQRKEDNSNILPKVHDFTMSTMTKTKSKPNFFLKTATISGASSTTASFSNDNNKQSATSTSSLIDEQNINILPDQQQQQQQQRHFILNGDNTMTANNHHNNNNNNNNNTNDQQVSSSSSAATATASSASTLQKRLRGSRGQTINNVSHQQTTAVAAATKNIDGTISSGFALSGVRSLPMTPPGLTERAQITLSCPDGLAHALSEQNIRLHQIVQEHKLREDVLLREIHDMRIQLLRKMCPNCNSSGPSTSDGEQCCGVETAENTSICSWEAVEDRSGPPSSNSSSVQQNATSVLWVPDHAVSRCTTCKTEFWIGRRKHHCRSCGRIFCADCSEFWAPLPNEKLFAPVRMCAPCYEIVVQNDNTNNKTVATTTFSTAAGTTTKSIVKGMNLIDSADQSSASITATSATSGSGTTTMQQSLTPRTATSAAAVAAMSSMSSGPAAVKIPVQPASAATTSNA